MTRQLAFPRSLTAHLAVLVLLAAAGCAEAPESTVSTSAGTASEQALLLPSASSQGPEPVGVSAREVFRFETIAQMVATSDAVVVGVAQGEARGRIVGEPPGQLQFRDVTVEVASVLAGTYTVGDQSGGGGIGMSFS